MIMASGWLILADDLTGAADCAIAFAKQGVEAVVAWDVGSEGKGFAWEPAVLSVDVDSRRFPAAAAAERQLAAQSAHWRPGLRLYKKIDSTLRGPWAAELAAQLAALAALGGGRGPLAVVAPAFPATGRVTVGGRVLVNGVPLEETPLWARDHSYANAFLPEILANAGLAAEVIPLDVVRKGPDTVYAQMRDAAGRGIAAVVCDCAGQEDLRAVAAASLRLDSALWVGSAGLAAALAALVAPAEAAALEPLHPRGSILTVVGSLAEASRLQAGTLAEEGAVQPVAVTAETLLGGATGAAWQTAHAALSEALAAGRDVLLTIVASPHPDLSLGPTLAARLATLVEDLAPRIGALVATGGDTACALLSHLGVQGIRLLDEVEPGVPLGLTLGARSIPVVTKAGAFGDGGTLRRCLDRLKA